MDWGFIVLQTKTFHVELELRLTSSLTLYFLFTYLMFINMKYDI